MLIQLSPWQTVETSLSTEANGKRRRTRSNSTLSETGHASHLPVEASIVSLIKRHRPSKRKLDESDGVNSEDVMPFVALTTPHRVVLVGNVIGKKKMANVDGPRISESAKLQYSCRPGNNSSFIPEQTTDAHAYPCVPAFVNGKNERIYALQQQNRSLSCWKVKCDGPDDTSSPLSKLKLPDQAIDMNIFQDKKGEILYGTLMNGTIYLGVWSSSDQPKSDVLSLETFKSLNENNHTPLFTTLTAFKSKAEERFELVQLFASRRAFLVVKSVLFIVNGQVQLQEQSSSHIDALSSRSKKSYLESTNILCCKEGECITVVYEEKLGPMNGAKVNGEKVKHIATRRTCCRISVSTGLVDGEPFDLSPTARHIGYVTSSLLAVATIDSVMFYEVKRGILVRSVDVSNVVADSKNWKLVTDGKRKVIILSMHSNKIYVSTSDLHLEDDSAKGKKCLDLASGLRSSIAATAHAMPASGSSPKQLLPLLNHGSKLSGEEVVEKRVTEAIELLNQTVDMILDPKDDNVCDHLLLSAYEKAVSMIFPSHKTMTLTNGKNGKNGKKMSKNKKQSPAFRADTPPAIPLEFVDGVTSLLVTTLRLPQTDRRAVSAKLKFARLDAGTILFALVRSGRVSARRHFQIYDSAFDDDDIFFSILGAMKATNKQGKRAPSAVDLVHQILTSCTDVTEKQLVTMIRFMMSASIPDDIADNFLNHQSKASEHHCRKLAENFLRVRSSVRRLRAQGVEEDNDSLLSLERQSALMSSNILKFGMIRFVDRVISYSNVNVSLLRTALGEGLLNRHEASSLAKVLIRFITNESVPSCPYTSERVSVWLLALCEGCRDAMSQPSANGKNELETILGKLQSALSHNQLISSLLHVVPQSAALSDSSTSTHKSSRKRKKVDHNQENGSTKKSGSSGYSIEQIVF